MKSAHELRDQYAELAEELEVVVDIARDEKRDLSEEENTRVTEIESRLNKLEGEIKVRERIEARLNKKAIADQKADVRHKREPETEDKKVVSRYNFLKAINERTKGRGLTGLEAEMHQEAEREARQSNLNLDGFGVPSMFFTNKRDLLDGTAALGGNTVQTSVSSALIDYLWPRTTVESLGATVLTGLTSNLTFPTKSAIPTGTWEGETDAGAESLTSGVFGTVSLTPNRVGTYVDISKQLMVQTQVPGLDQMVRRDIERAIAIALETAAINGSGTNNQPTGILNNGSVGVEAIGTNGGSPDWGNIVALEANVANDNADMGSLAYLTTPGIRGNLKTIEKASSTAQFIWETQAMAGVPATVGEGQLNGYRAAVSTLVPSNLEKGTGYNLHAMLFGNWNDLLIGQFGGLDIVVDPYTQAANTLLRIVVNSWWDIAVRHAESFAVIKDASAGEFNT